MSHVILSEAKNPYELALTQELAGKKVSWPHPARFLERMILLCWDQKGEEPDQVKPSYFFTNDILNES